MASAWQWALAEAQREHGPSLESLPPRNTRRPTLAPLDQNRPPVPPIAVVKASPPRTRVQKRRVSWAPSTMVESPVPAPVVHDGQAARALQSLFVPRHAEAEVSPANDDRVATTSTSAAKPRGLAPTSAGGPGVTDGGNDATMESSPDDVFGKDSLGRVYRKRRYGRASTAFNEDTFDWAILIRKTLGKSHGQAFRSMCQRSGCPCSSSELVREAVHGDRHPDGTDVEEGESESDDGEASSPAAVQPNRANKEAVREAVETLLERLQDAGLCTRVVLSPISSAEENMLQVKDSRSAKSSRRSRGHRRHWRKELQRRGGRAEVMIKVKAPGWRLEEEAEAMGLSMRRRTRARDGEVPASAWGAALVQYGPFKRSERTSFLGAGYSDKDGLTNAALFSSAQRQLLTQRIMDAPVVAGGAGLGPGSALRRRVVGHGGTGMFPLHMNVRLLALREEWVTFWRHSVEWDFGGGDGRGNQDGGRESASQVSASSCGRRVERMCPTATLLRRAFTQPLDDITRYFGAEIGFYFAYLQFYTSWLAVPAIAGIGLTTLQVRAGAIDIPLAPFWALFMALWTACLLVSWRRRRQLLAHRWGVENYEHEEQRRPGFRSVLRRSRVTGETVAVDANPFWRRVVVKALTSTVMTSFVLLVLTAMLLLFGYRDSLVNADSQASTQSPSTSTSSPTLRHGQSGTTAPPATTGAAARTAEGVVDMVLGRTPREWGHMLLPAVLYGLMIPMLDRAAHWLAAVCTTAENHETESAHHHALVLKVFAFRFVNCFSSLYYYAFNHQASASATSPAYAASTASYATGTTTAAPASSGIDTVADTTTRTSAATSAAAAASLAGQSLVKVAVQLGSFMVVGQIVGQAQEIILPYVKRQMALRLRHTCACVSTGGSASASPHRRRRSRQRRTGITDTKSRTAGPGAWAQARMGMYSRTADHAELMIQFGFVAFFSMAFPLAPLFALLNNLVEMRGDAFKLCHELQRPVARQASGIGVWRHVLLVMSVVAIVTNCAHIGITSQQLTRVFPMFTEAHRVYLIFAVEHAVLLIAAAIHVLVPAQSKRLKRALEREGFEQRLRASALPQRRQQHGNGGKEEEEKEGERKDKS